MRYYFHIDPTALTDKEWAYMWHDLLYCLKFDGDRYAEVTGLTAQSKSNKQVRTF